MDAVLFYLSILILIVFIYLGIELAAGVRKIKFLKDVNSGNLNEPRISVIIAARNEERNIKKSLSSIISQNYENYEIIVVNDRSTDRTHEIADNIARQENRVKLLKIENLPAGWLGKNHALQYGADNSTGDYLLFTDADVIMDKDTLRKAAEYITRNDLDHIAAAPSIKIADTITDMFGAVFPFYFSVYSKPWKAKDPESRYSLGIGAFNLIGSKFYSKIGGHHKIKMRPDDDLKLGRLIKASGGRQEILYGKGMIEVEWYSSVKELVNGLLKNSFAAYNYNPILLILSNMGLLLFGVYPFAAVFITGGITQVIYLIAMHGIIIAYSKSTKYTGAKKWYVIAFPFVTLLFIFIQIRAMFYVLANKGITWRGTFYPLAELKNKQI